MEYTKPYLSFEQQADKLIERGMQGSRDDLIEHLSDVGYYRLSGYWYIYRNPDSTFRKGTTFADVWQDYVFDRQFRLVMLDAIERVEIYFRTQLAHVLARETGSFGFMEPGNLPRLKDHDYQKFIRKCKEKQKQSREPFAVHFKETYGDTHDLPPYWVLVNMMDFGQMLTLYRGASVEIRNEISAAVGVSARVLDSWLRTLNTARNICAHHGRLWNRTLGTKPRVPKDAQWHEPFEVSPDKVFSVLTILSYLLEIVAPQTSWRSRLMDLLAGRSEADLARMGFVSGWESCALWEPYLNTCEGNVSTSK